MPKGKPLSAAHKAAISAGMKRYWASRSAGGSSSTARTSQHVETGRQISRADAAAIMFGSKAAAKKIKKATSRKKR